MFEKYTIQQTISHLKSDTEKGLTESEAFLRLRKHGKNELKEPPGETLLENFLGQLSDPLIYVLLAAAGISIFLGESSDAVIIGAVIMLNAVVGMIQEGRAQKALEALKKLTTPHAIVIRDGVKKEIPASDLVPGDLVCLEAGMRVPADIRLTESTNLKAEEAALTGESLPIEKDYRFVADGKRELPLGEHRNRMFMTTVVIYGRGMGLVTETGMNTQIGRIAALIAEEKEELTPLQKRLAELGKYLSFLSVVLCGALFMIALLQKRNLFEMLLTAISLAVAAVPEGLPAVVTICLALSVTRMVKVNTIIRRLPSVETLGAVSVVCSDKTGTLTQNRMSVEAYWEAESRSVDNRVTADWSGKNRIADNTAEISERLLHACVLCNDASMTETERIGDPTELALLDLGARSEIQKMQLEKRMPRQGELPFDSDRKMMTTCHRDGGRLVSYTKGAPDEVLKRCTHIYRNGKAEFLSETYRQRAKQAMSEMSSKALRTLGIAMAENVSGPVEERLILLGIVGMKDPPRPEAAEAVATFRQAGVSTVMITGDHAETAFAIGKQLGIAERMEQCMSGEELGSLREDDFLERLPRTRVFARVSPAQKVRIVKGFQALDHVVAMTGDGVNDAPSLKAADIGIAMGMTGTDVAKQAADMILTDDNFATIRKAIEVGRGVYENIRKSVIFLLSSNLGEIMTMFLAVLWGLSSPLKSSHILWINLITDSLPALALGVDKNDGRSIMGRPPRKAGESLFAKGGLFCTCFYGVVIAAVSLSAFLLIPVLLLNAGDFEMTFANIRLLLEQESILLKAQTYAFTVLGMSQLFHAIGMRDTRRSVLRMNHLENKLMVLACIVGFALQFAVTEVAFLVEAFGTAPLSGREWAILAALAAVPMLAHEGIVLLRKII